MATLPPDRRPTGSTDSVVLPATGTGRGTDHLKQVPRCLCQSEQIREAAGRLAAKLDRSRPLVRHEMERHARTILDELGFPEGLLGWAMVALGSEFWRDQVRAIPISRRLLLLPRCLRDRERCQATVDADGALHCVDCGACVLTALKTEAEGLGYRVLIAEGSPIVMRTILGGHVDAVLGVACLDVLEKTLDKVLLAGIPCMAQPLLSAGCENTVVNEHDVRAMFATPDGGSTIHTHTYLHLMRCAAQLFEPAELQQILPPRRSKKPLGRFSADQLRATDPIECTEAIANDFLAAGGKHSRPFITLAAYDAAMSGPCTEAGGADAISRLPVAVKQMALAIESFHKASLVHDDIEDNDAFRYDQATLHRRFGTATAINVGDYLIGIGYRLVGLSRSQVDGQTVADLLEIFAGAHTRLCEGQGAELVWRDARDRRLAPIDALKIYALKTAPAFEAALLAGLRLAGPTDRFEKAAKSFSRHLGIAYQILNDLDDWNDPRDGTMSGKRITGGDLLRGRPTILWALAMETLDSENSQALMRLVTSPRPERGMDESEDTATDADIALIGEALALYEKAGVFDVAAAMVTRHHAKAIEAADTLGDEPLRRLLHFLADAILDRRPLAISEG